MMNYNKVSVSFLLPPLNAPRQKERVKRHASYTQETALTQQDIYSCGYADGGRRQTFDCSLTRISLCSVVAAFSIVRSCTQGMRSDDSSLV